MGNCLKKTLNIQFDKQTIRTPPQSPLLCDIRYNCSHCQGSDPFVCRYLNKYKPPILSLDESVHNHLSSDYVYIDTDNH